MTDSAFFPNIVIAGAPKCATTSVFNWLSQHPDVKPSSVKEPRFLIDPGYPLLNQQCNVNKDGVDGYREFFKHHFDTNGVFLEATPDYLYQKVAPVILSTLPSNPDVLFILRKPSERVFSLFRFAQNNVAVLSKKVSFSEFVEAILEEKRASFLDNMILKKAIEHSQYIDYLEQWIKLVDPERIHLLLYEDLRKDPFAFMMQLACRVGLEGSTYGNFAFDATNVTHSARSQIIQKLKMKFSDMMPHGVIRDWMSKIYFVINVRSGARFEMTTSDLDTLKTLNAYFAPYNARLKGCLDVDIRKWE